MEIIDFVILHYGDAHVTDNCIRSIQKMNGQDRIRIVVVDNNIHQSAGQREKLCKRYKRFSHISVLTITEDGGFSYANNAGYRYARDKDRADWICIINNDVEFTQPEFPDLIEEIYRETGCHILSPDIIKKSDGEHQSPMDTRLRTSDEARYTVDMNARMLKIYGLAFPALYLYQKRQDRKRVQKKKQNSEFYRKRQENIVPFGACLIFTPSFVKEEENAFEPETHFYYEEYLLTHRCERLRYTILYDPSVRVLHESGTATKRSLGSERRRMKFIMEETKKSADIYLKEILSDKKPSMLYFMQVDWNWIAQRPHFMALELENDFAVKVLYPQFLIRTWKAQKNTEKPGQCKGVPQIPLQEKNALLRRLGDFVYKRYIGNIYDYDVVWLSTPLYFRFVPKDYTGIVVYDYMDDVVALEADPVVKKRMEKYHFSLLRRADVVFASSQHLRDHLPETVRNKVFIIRNGYRQGTVYSPEAAERKTTGNGKIRLGYVGTISKWIDFPLLLESLEKYPQLEYHFWGPVACDVPEHAGLIFHGIVEHSNIYENIRDMDGLIMPFILNDITLAVDPVKLYEYIGFGKPIISIGYKEIERFRDFVMFYHTNDEYNDIIQKLADGNCQIKYSRKQQELFLRDSSWQARENAACEVLKDVMGRNT